MSNKILGILEQREGRLKKVSFEVLQVVSDMASGLNYECDAVVIGNEISNLDEIGNYGVKKIIHFKNNQLGNYSSSAYTKIIADYAKETSADILVFSATALGKDLAPHVAARLDAGVASDCIHIETTSGDLTATRPVYAGKALIDVKIKSPVKVLSIRPNVFKATPQGNGINAEIEIKQVPDPDLKTKVIEIKKSEGKLDVAEADIIVSGGRGMKGPENFHLVEELADVLGGAVGSSRAAVDAGWRPHREQVGQTGKTVSPSLYIACGISGAIQHLAGMSSSKYIVAINKDKDAPIFGVADYGIAGDLFEILPVLTEEIKKIK